MDGWGNKGNKGEHGPGSLKLGAHPSPPHHLTPYVPQPGFVDVADLVAATLERGLTLPPSHTIASLLRDFFLVDDPAHVAISVMNASGHNEFVTVPVSSTMFEVRCECV